MTRLVRTAFNLFLMMFCVTALLIGCQGGATKAGTQYKMLASRELEARFEGDLATVHDTAVGVLRDDYAFTITKDAKDALEGVIEATTARNDRVTVQTYKESSGITAVQVWAGPFGDRSRAEDILNTIEAKIPGGVAK
jgi:hypothetical protein